MSKSHVQHNADEKKKKKSWKEKKGKRETKHSYSSRALIIWQILFWMMAILPKRGRKPEGGRWRRGSCTLLYGGHGGKLQSSVTHLEYLTHTERHYFSLISRLFFSVLTATTISTETAWDPASILRVKQEWRLCPLEGDDDESQTQTCFIKTESEKRWVIKCVCRENTGRDHNSITPIWSSVCASMWNTLGLNSITRNCYLKAATLLKVQKSTIAKRHVFDVLLSKTNSKYILSRVLRCALTVVDRYTNCAFTKNTQTLCSVQPVVAAWLEQQCMRQILPYVAGYTHIHMHIHTENTQVPSHAKYTLVQSHSSLQDLEDGPQTHQSCQFHIEWECVIFTVFIWITGLCEILMKGAG